MSPMLKLPLAMEHALLGFLMRAPLHAYEIHRQLNHNHDLGLVWRIKQSLVYVLLEKLEAEGYLTTSTEPQGNRPPRKLRHITPAGRAAFERWLHSPVEHGRDFRQEFLAKVFFAQRADDPRVLAQLVARQRAACQQWLADLQQQLAAAEAPFAALVLQFRIGQIESILHWLDACTVDESIHQPT
jgi:DNA-binding PadR family transcriptional regulator